MFWKVFVLMGFEQQCVILDNAHSTPKGDCVAYDLCPFCLMLAHPQKFSVLMSIDFLIFCYHTTAQE